jgi:uncharacterized protein YjbI with pentapeptide repeats
VSSSEPEIRLNGRRAILPTGKEWWAVAVLAALAVIGFLTYKAAGRHVLHELAVGLGASVLSLAAAVAVVRGFRRAVARVPDTTPPMPRRSDGGSVPGGGRQLKGADLRGANLIDADLEACDLVNARLEGANLSYARLDRSLVMDARLVDAVLRETWLTQADLRGADLTRADLTGAHLRGANLAGARLEGADLRNADLGDASLEGADLRHVDIDGASLAHARLKGADCRGVPELAKHLTEEQLKPALTNEDLPWLSTRLMKVSTSARSKIRKREQ